MQQILASSFTTAAILTWALPIALLTLVGLVWWFVLSKTDLGDELDSDSSA
jgi:cytochrome c-type biogenesis protein CcmH/NrfF